MKLFRETSFSLGLLVGIFILLVLTAPAMAAADDYHISYNWTSGKNAEAQVESFQPTNTSTLTYTIVAKNSTSQIYFIANVAEEGVEPKPGFNISGYPKTDLISAGTTVAEIKNTAYNRSNGTLIIPLSNAAQRFSIDLTIESDAATVYHNETNKITAGLYIKDGDHYVPISNTVISTANNQYPQLSSRGTFALLNPSLMPSGESEIDLKYVFYTTTDINSIWNTLGTKSMRMKFESFTLDFSNVSITADGVTQNYSQWVGSGNSPVLFGTANAAGYTVSQDGLNITFTPNSSSYGNFSWNQTFNFSINTTEDFKYNNSVPPAINFTNLTVSADMKLNGRGDAVQFTNIEKVADNNAAYLLPHYTAGTLTGANTNKLSSTLYNSSGSGLIVSNSESYDPSSPFYYQELFKATFRNTVRNGTDETLTFDIPDGITVTHIRAPKNGTEVSMYDKISILKDGKTYELNHTVNKTYDLSALTAKEDSTPFIPYISGEDVVLKIDNLILLEGSTGGIYSYSSGYTISFAGTTNLLPGTHSFKVSDDSGVLATRSFTAATDYIVSPYLSNIVRYLTNSNTSYGESPSLVGRGDTFYMFNTFNASGYPYGSALRVSPTNTTGIYSNPVVYFSVPPGLEVGTAQITLANGTDVIASGAFRDINGRTLNITQKEIPNAGLYAGQGGKLIEVKIHLNESGKEDETFWINATPRYARLPVTVSQEYTGDSFVFTPSSVLISSWDPAARTSQTGGAGGTNHKFTSDFDQTLAYSNIYGSYPSYLMNMNVYVQDDATVISSTGVRIGSGYVYYNPSSDDSYPSLKAGSKNEMFKVYFYNGLGETVGGDMDPATIYFILPTHDDVWRASLMNVTSLDIVESGNIGQYLIYYSTDDFSDNVGSLALNDVDDSFNSSLTWEPITNVADTSGMDWSEVTAIKCEIYDAVDKSRFELLLPFELPPVDGSSVEFEQTAIGQTLYDVSVGGTSLLSSTKGYTAAILLTESDGPEIQTLSNIPQGQSVDYKTGTLPEWYNVITHDDFTENIEIQSVSIVYTDLNGINTTYPVSVTDLFNRTALPASTGYAAGYQYTINTEAVNPVTNNQVGNYTITYNTTADDENKVGSLTVKFQITKAASTIVLDTPAGQEIFMDTEIPVPAPTWADYFRQYVSGNDTGVSIPSDKFIYNESGSTLNSNVPENYVMVYDYTDIGLTKKSSTVNVAVKYADELIVNAFAANSPVTDLTVSIQSDGASAVSATYENDKSGYNASIKAVKDTPTTISYKITYSDVPAGLIDSHSGSAAGSATYAAVSSPVVYDLEFTPAQFVVQLDNAAGIKNISLYQVVDTGDLCIETITLAGSETSVTFETEEGWFDDEEYYLTAELFPGYVSSSSDDFNEAGSLIYLETSVQEFNNNDIILDLFVEKSVLISGSLWNDVNRDSIMDETESVISSATVNLLNDDFVVIASTATSEDGSYYFIDLDKNSEYYVQVKIPAGYNRVSEFKDDQKINGSNNYSSDIVAFTSEFHQTDVNAGFYRVNSGGGSGNATVVDPVNPTTPMGGVEDGGNTGNSSNNTGYELPEVIQKSGNLWILLLLLLVVVIAAGAVYYYKVKKNK